MSNSFGRIFTFTSFGESHGPALGGVIDGCPPGITLDFEAIDAWLSRRRPGQSPLTTARSESDKVHFLSGILNGVTTGAPIGFYIENQNTRSKDYNDIAKTFRPGHADYTYFKKYGGHNDISGGGRSSARETVCRVVCGAIAMQVLNHLYPNLKITAFTQSVGPIEAPDDYLSLDFDCIETNAVRCPHASTAAEMEKLILSAKSEGDTVGGVVRCVVSGCPVGIGEPVFDKLSARLASAMMSINAAKGFEIGAGFSGSRLKGSETIDNWLPAPDDARGMRTATNNSGGIQGGISNGEDIVFDVAFKPVATLLRAVETVDRDGHPTLLNAHGRHDACVVPRAVPVVEAMTAMVLLDQILIRNAYLPFQDGAGNS